VIHQPVIKSVGGDHNNKGGNTLFSNRTNEKKKVKERKNETEQTLEIQYRRKKERKKNHGKKEGVRGRN
jgi:hypothetical protein